MITPRRPSTRVAVLILVGLGILFSPIPLLPGTSQVSRALSWVLSDRKVFRPERSDIEQQPRTSRELRFQYKWTVFEFKLQSHDMCAADC